MAGTLKFAITPDFKAMIEQAEKTKKPVCLVKDQGVYMMSFGRQAPKGNKVCYADGLDPNKADFDDWYDTAHRICGGDDFAEHIPSDFFRRAIDKGCKMVKVKLTARNMSLEAQ